MYPQHLDELFVSTVQTVHLYTDQVQLPKEDAIANQHQHDDEDKAECQAAMDVDAVKEWNVRQRMPQPPRKSRRAVGVRHALSLLEFPTDQPPVERPAGDLASEPVPQSDPCDFESRSVVPS
jgi:hypothetical protein